MLLPLQLQLNLYDSSATLTADPGALTLTGGEATLTATGLSATITADGGALTLTGGEASLPISMGASPAALALTGGDATLTPTENATLTADGGALLLSGGTATLTATGVAVPSKAGGRSKGRRRYYSVEVEGEVFVFSTVADVEAFLQTVREEAEEQADKLVTTPVVPKPPKIKVKTAKGRVSTSKTVTEAVKRTQKAVNRAYVQAAKRRAVDQEISQLILKQIEKEQDEEAIIALLMM